jgi:hypothetical protein
VTGEISDAGNRYRIALRAVVCETGDTVSVANTEVFGRNQIVRALGAVGEQLRRSLGEPDVSVQRFSTPLDQATSSSLEALQTYSQGEKEVARHRETAIPYFVRATEIDPEYAMAYGWLTDLYRADSTTAKAAVTKAYQLRNRLTEHDRYPIEYIYYREGTGELEKAAQADEQMIQIFPRDWFPRIGLSVILGGLAQQERAAAEAREAIRLLPEIGGFNNLMDAEIWLDRLDDAKAVYEEAQSHGLDHSWLRSLRYQLAFVQKDEKSMQGQVAWAEGKPGGDAIVWQEGQTAAYNGQIRSAHHFGSKAAALVAPVDSNSAATYRAYDALQYAEAGFRQRAHDEAARALADKPADRNIRVIAALTFARIGDVPDTQKLVDELDKEFPLSTTVQNFHLPTIRAAIELDRRNPVQALQLLQRAAPYELAETESFDELYPAYVRGMAYLQLAQGRPASIEFQKLLGHRGVVKNWITGALAHLQLGRAQVMMGD